MAARGQAPAPPSTGRIAPVTMEARSLSSQAAASATSRGSAIRPSGMLPLIIAWTPGDAASQASIISVLVPPAAFVTSATFEVLAWNDLAAALMEDFGRLAPPERNLARRVFLAAPTDRPPFGLADTTGFRRHAVMRLRATHARYPRDPAVSCLVAELRASSADFARRWEQRDVRATPMLTKTFRHPAVGEVTVDCDSLALTERDQQLVLYTAPTGSVDADALALLAVLGPAHAPVRSAR